MHPMFSSTFPSSFRREISSAKLLVLQCFTSFTVGGGRRLDVLLLIDDAQISFSNIDVLFIFHHDVIVLEGILLVLSDEVTLSSLLDDFVQLSKTLHYGALVILPITTCELSLVLVFTQRSVPRQNVALSSIG